VRLAWLTDIHLNFVEVPGREALYGSILETGCDAVLLTGDIGDAPALRRFLLEIESALEMPVFFVLGNHDFYHDSIRRVRRRVEALCENSPHLRWMPRAGAVILGPGTVLLGHDGWADGRYGDYHGSNLALNDYICIHELRNITKGDRLRQMQSLAGSAASFFRRTLPGALRRYRNVVVLTHPPPFREACRHDGGPSDEGSLPHFASKAVGDVLRGAMEARPDRSLTVLCGHTHSEARAWILPNLRVYAGGATYGAPEIQGVLLVPDEGRVFFENQGD